MFEKAYRLLFHILRYVVGTVGIALALVILLQIGGRLFLTRPYPWTEELARFLFIWFCFLGASLALEERGHLGFDGLTSRLPEALRKPLAYLAYAVMAFFTYVMIREGWRITEVTAIQRSPIMRLPMSWMYVTIPLTGVLMSLTLVQHVLKGRVTEPPAHDETVPVAPPPEFASAADSPLNSPSSEGS